MNYLCAAIFCLAEKFICEIHMIIIIDSQLFKGKTMKYNGIKWFSSA